MWSTLRKMLVSSSLITVKNVFNRFSYRVPAGGPKNAKAPPMQLHLAWLTLKKDSQFPYVCSRPDLVALGQTVCLGRDSQIHFLGLWGPALVTWGRG